MRVAKSRLIWRRTALIAVFAVTFASPVVTLASEELLRQCYFTNKGNAEAIGGCVAKGLAPPTQAPTTVQKPAVKAADQPAASQPTQAAQAAKTVRVPAVVGKARAGALVAIRDAGLVVRLDTENSVETTDHRDAGLIARTAPAPGAEVTVGSLVNVIPYDYRRPTLDETFPTPAVIDRAVTQAVGVLRTHGLRPKVGVPIYGKSAEWKTHTGFVAEQDPNAGTPIKRGAAVVLRPKAYSIDGLPPFEGEFHPVPDVRAQAVADALQALRTAGFTGRAAPDDFVATTDAAKDGRVAEQVPGAHNIAPKGTRVSLIRFAKGAEKHVFVPKLYGLPVAAAKRALEDMGLRMAVNRFGVKPTDKAESVGRVADHHPAHANTVRQGETITVYLFAARAATGDRIAVPQVSHQTLDVAERKLKAAGLKFSLGTWGRKYPPVVTYNRQWDKRVARQVPESDTLVAKGTVIQLHVFKFALERPMPDLVGVHWVKAEARLKAANLTYRKTETTRPTTEPAKNLTVAATDPPAGRTMIRNDNRAQGAIKVTLYAYAGPSGDLVRVPQLKNLKKAQAQAKLKAAGLFDQPYYSLHTDAVATKIRAQDGVVHSQNPLPGQFTKKGSRVRLKLYALAPYRPVPDLKGKPWGDAARALSGLKFMYRPLYVPTGNADLVGTVANTVPAAGAPAPVGMPPRVLVRVYTKAPPPPTPGSPTTTANSPTRPSPTASTTGATAANPPTRTSSASPPPTVLTVDDPVGSGPTYVSQFRILVGNRDIYYATWFAGSGDARKLTRYRDKTLTMRAGENARILLKFSAPVGEVKVRAGGIDLPVKKAGKLQYREARVSAETLARIGETGTIGFEISATDENGRAIDADPASIAAGGLSATPPATAQPRPQIFANAEAGPDKTHRVLFADVADLPYPVVPFALSTLFSPADTKLFGPSGTNFTAWGGNGISSYDLKKAADNTTGFYVEFNRLTASPGEAIEIPCPARGHFGCAIEDTLAQRVAAATPSWHGQYQYRYQAVCYRCYFEIMIQITVFNMPPRLLARAVERDAKKRRYRPLSGVGDMTYWVRQPKQHAGDPAYAAAVLGNALVSIHFPGGPSTSVAGTGFDGTPSGFARVIEQARRKAKIGEALPELDGGPAKLSYETIIRAVVGHLQARLGGLPSVAESKNMVKARGVVEAKCAAAARETHAAKRVTMKKVCTAARRELFEREAVETRRRREAASRRPAKTARATRMTPKGVSDATGQEGSVTARRHAEAVQRRTRDAAMQTSQRLRDASNVAGMRRSLDDAMQICRDSTAVSTAGQASVKRFCDDMRQQMKRLQQEAIRVRRLFK